MGAGKEKSSWLQNFFERILDYFEKKQVAQIKQANLNRQYYDVARVLWYDVGYDNILKYKRAKMDIQRELFLTYTMGNRTFRYGPISALTGVEDRRMFSREAEAEIRDILGVTCKVSVYNDAVIVKF